MKKIKWGLLTLLLIWPVLGAAKTEDTFGVAGGVSSFNQVYSNSSGDMDGDASSALGVFAGVFSEIRWRPSLIFSPGFYYSQKKSEMTSQRLTANYLETSAMIKWYLINGFNFRAYLGAGLGFGILLSGSNVDNTGLETDISDTFARNELTGLGGLGIEFSLSNETAMQIGFSYVSSLTNNLNSETSAGVSGTWQGAYLFTAFRFKEKLLEDNSPEQRARDYLKFKYQSESKVQFEETETNESIQNELDLLGREPSSFTESQKRVLSPKYFKSEETDEIDW